MQTLFSILIAILAAAPCIAAAPRTILLLRPIAAHADEAVADSLTRSLRTSLEGMEFETVELRSDDPGAGATKPSACGDSACATAFARAHGTDFVAFGTMKAHNTSLSIRMRTIHTHSGQVVGTSASHVVDRRGASSRQLARDLARDIMPSAGILLSQGKALLRRPAEDTARQLEALSHLRRAAWLGSDSAAFILGSLHERGTKIPADTAAALSWYTLAAEHGLAPAQFNLACLLEGRSRTSGEWAQVVRWYRAAADQGMAKAQLNLGYLYSQGRGVERDEDAAYRYYRMAAAQGDATAAANLDALVQARLGASGGTTATRHQREQGAAAPPASALPVSPPGSSSPAP